MKKLCKIKSTDSHKKSLQAAPQDAILLDEVCLICNSILKIVDKIRPKVGDEIDSIAIAKQEKKADSLMKSLCNIFTLPYKLQQDDVKIAGGTGNGNFIYLEPCKTSPCCSICRTYVDEFFRTERQVNELIRQMSKLKHGIGSLIVDTFSATPSNIKNYSLKKNIYEAWFPKVHDDIDPPLPMYQSHSRFMKEGNCIPPGSGLSSRNHNIQTNVAIVSAEPVPLPLMFPSVTNFAEECVEDDHVEIDNATPMPSPQSVGRLDSDMEDAVGNNRVQLPENVNSITADDGIMTPQPENPIDPKCITITTDRRRFRLKKTFSFTCPYCEKKTTNRVQHLSHLRTHTGEKPFGCQYCTRKFADSRNKKQHELHVCKLRPPDDEVEQTPSVTKSKPKTTRARNGRRQLTDEGEIKMYKCPHCEKQWDTILSLKVHVDKAHPGKNPHKCRECDRTFVSYGNQLKHERTHDKSRLTGEPKYECDICGQKFHLAGTLYHHRRRAHLGVKYKKSVPKDYVCTCDICGKTFPQRFKLNRHKASIHEEKHYAWKCGICGKPCASTWLAKKHEETHKPNRSHDRLIQHKCLECPNHLGFSRKNIIRQHYKENHPEIEVPEHLKYKKKRKLYPCPECPMEYGTTFHNSRPLRRHLQKYHTGNNPPPYLGPRNKKQARSFVDKHGITRKMSDPGSESSSDESELELDDSNSSENDEDSSSETEVKLKTNRIDRIRTLGKRKTRSNFKPTTSTASKRSPSHNSHQLSAYQLPSRTKNTRKPQTGSRKSDNSSKFIELKSLRIHLTRIDEALTEVIVKEEVATEVEIQPPTLTIVDAYSISEEIPEMERTNPISVMSLSKITSFLNSSQTTNHSK